MKVLSSFMLSEISYGVSWNPPTVQRDIDSWPSPSRAGTAKPVAGADSADSQRRFARHDPMRGRPDPVDGRANREIVRQIERVQP